MTNMFSNPAFGSAYLSQNQQDLLMTALQSNLPDTNGTQVAQNSFDLSSASLDPAMLSVSQPDELYKDFDFTAFDDPTMIDLLDSTNQQDGDFDFDPDQDDENYPEIDGPATIGDGGEKRKSTSDGKDGNENGAKRREGEEKQAKKPGRKPLTSEPTSKRKAQNRAAQRAFRERKEKHLRDLEDKVAELEKTSEDTSHENNILRTQVEQLQKQLREYRKRLVQTNVGRSPPATTMGSFSSSASTALNPFSFDFPRFQTVPYGPLFGNNPLQASPQSTSIDFSTVFGTNLRHASDSTSSSINQANTPATSNSRSQHGSISQDSPKANPASPFGDFSSDMRTPSISSLAHVRTEDYNIFTSQSADPANMTQNSETSNPESRKFVFVPTSSASPSASSSSHSYGPSSSCGTSPEPTTGVNKEPTLNTIDESDAQKEANSQANQSTNSSDTPQQSIEAASSLDFTGALVTGSNSFFSFGDQDTPSWTNFPESSTAITADGAFTGGFFNDSNDFFNMSMPVPMNWNDLTGNMRTGLTPVSQKSNPFEPVEPMPKIEEELCITLMKNIQSHPDSDEITIKDVDIDSLCSELKKKARCSENGIVIAKHDMEEAMQRQAALAGKS